MKTEEIKKALIKGTIYNINNFNIEWIDSDEETDFLDDLKAEIIEVIREV